MPSSHSTMSVSMDLFENNFRNLLENSDTSYYGSGMVGGGTIKPPEFLKHIINNSY